MSTASSAKMKLMLRVPPTLDGAPPSVRKRRPEFSSAVVLPAPGGPMMTYHGRLAFRRGRFERFLDPRRGLALREDAPRRKRAPHRDQEDRDDDPHAPRLERVDQKRQEDDEEKEEEGQREERKNPPVGENAFQCAHQRSARSDGVVGRPCGPS